MFSSSIQYSLLCSLVFQVFERTKYIADGVRPEYLCAMIKVRVHRPIVPSLKKTLDKCTMVIAQMMHVSNIQYLLHFQV